MPYIKPLLIGHLNFSSNLIQGPLAGYSCAAYRKLFYHFQAPAYCVTEMISAPDLIKNNRIKKRFVYRDRKEKYLCYQFGGYELGCLGLSAKQAMDWGADLIDLNCGCPKPKIRKKKMGSYLLDQPDHIAKIVETVKCAVSLPVTVKIRLFHTTDHEINIRAINKIINAGADTLIVHGRHWSEDYDTPCQLAAISEIVKASKVPIIGNGDIFNYADLKKMFEVTHCAGIMISRKGTGNPWLYEKLMAEDRGEVYMNPSFEKIKNLFLEHLDGLATLENEWVALLQSRKLLKYYFPDKITENDFSRYCTFTTQKEVIQFLKEI